MSSGVETRQETFGSSVQAHLRISGYSQKNLADELGMNRKVFSRKLNGSSNAYLTRIEVKKIIIQLVHWKGITSRDEALELLKLAQAGPNIFSTEEWETPPLNELTVRDEQPVLSSTSTQNPCHNLTTHVTRLIGRELAVEQLRRLLERDEVRLVTLVGSGGSGKTRLAQHVAGTLIDAFAHGVWFVGLSGVRDPAQVPMSIIQVLNIQLKPGIAPRESLITYLRDKQLLLILDNFEQLAEGAPIVSELLAAAPGLKVLLTSRMVLHLYGENEYNVPPLDLPDTSTMPTPTQLARYGAIQLFVERARAVDPDFTLTAKNAASIAKICARVDGLPLALELAAARVKVLSPERLLKQLSGARLPVLVGGAIDMPDRQQTLQNTITWSYDLLSPNEQDWFCRLGIFNGEWSFEAVEALMREVAADDEIDSAPVSTMSMLEQLVNNSLLVRLPVSNGEVRFTMLETLREYAVERLIEKGEFERLSGWHASYYLEMAEAGEIGLRGPRQLEWMKRLSAKQDNFQAAMEWSLKKARAGKKIHSLSHFGFRPAREARETARDNLLSPGSVPEMEMPALELCLRLTSALRPYLEWQGYLEQGRDRLKAVLEIPLEEGVEKRVLAARARALNEMARLVCLQNDQYRAVELAEESIALWQQVDDVHGLATALLHRGWPALALADFETARHLYEQGLQLLTSSDINDEWLRAQFLFYLGSVAGFTRDFEQMRAFYAQSRALFEQVGDKSALADLMKDQGGMMILEGNYAVAVTNLVKSIKMSRELGHKHYITTALGLLGFAVGMEEKPDPQTASLMAAKIWGAADGRYTTTGFTPWLSSLSTIQEVILQIRCRVDKQSWKDAFKAGKAMNEEQVIALACSL